MKKCRAECRGAAQTTLVRLAPPVSAELENVVGEDIILPYASTLHSALCTLSALHSALHPLCTP